MKSVLHLCNLRGLWHDLETQQGEALGLWVHLCSCDSEAVFKPCPIPDSCNIINFLNMNLNTTNFCLKLPVIS